MTQLATPRTRIALVTPTDARALHQYYTRNHAHLSPWEPRRPTGYHSHDAWQKRAADQAAQNASGQSYHFAVRCHGADDVAAVCNLTNITKGAFQACHLGYSVDLSHQGHGILREALTEIIPFVFAHAGLNRIMANYMPRNERSGRLLARLGFEKEGYAKRYLKIAGEWEDHILTSRIIDHAVEA